MLKQLLPCVGEYKKPMILTPVTMLGEVVMEVLIPFVMALMIDNGIMGDKGLPYTIQMGILMTALSVVSLIFGALSGKYAAEASMGFAKNVRTKLFDKVQNFSFANVDQFSTASLITRLTTDVTNTQNAVMMIIRVGVRAPFMFIGALIMSLRANVQLSMIFVVAIPVVVISVILIATTAMPRFKQMLAEYDKLNLTVQENLTGIRAVKAFVRETYENKKFRSQADLVRSTQLSAEKVVIMGMPMMMLCMSLCIVSALWFGNGLIMNGEMEIGQLSSFTTYIIQILMSLMMVAMVMINLVLSRASVSRIVEVLEAEIDLKDENPDPELFLEDGSIVFDDVSFQYSTEAKQATLENISVSIDSGETVGIIGGTGSGKTSLVQLIPRLYDISGGSIRVGKHPVKEYTLEHLRNEVAMVMQKNILFSGTIKENLKWGNADATDEQIEEACQAACAHDFIMSFSKQYDTHLGRGGVNVSGGQKQRLCIARALLKKPKIVILDDSTSAVDTATDSKIRAAFREQLKGTTTLIVAQRIASVMDADKIIVLDKGRIDGCGTHEELLESNQIYREVYESQQKGVE